MVTVAGLTEIEVKCAATTVSVDVSDKAPNVAVIVVWPAATVVTKPAVLTVATDAEDELQVTPLLRSELEPSLYVAVATYCWLIPIPSVCPTGVTEIETMVGAVTVRVVVPETPLKLAWILVEPAVAALAMPPVLMVATDVAEEVQVTRLVRSALLPSL